MNEMDWIMDQRRVELLRRQVALGYRRHRRRVVTTLIGVAVLGAAIASTIILWITDSKLFY